MVLSDFWSESDFVVVILKFSKFSIHKLFNDPHLYVATMYLSSWFDAIDELYVKLLALWIYIYWSG